MSAPEGNQLLIDTPPSYKKLVKLLAHAFYSGECPPKDVQLPGDAAEAPSKPPPPSNAKKIAQADTTGLGVILLSALTERQWVKEDELARDLTLHPKMVRRALRYLEQEQLVQREHRKENQRTRKREAALLNTAAPNPEDDEGPGKGLTISYCALDYPRIMDVVRYRLAVMPKQVKKEVEGGSVVQRFRCTSQYCGKEFTSFEMFNLARGGDTLLCDVCDSPVEAVLGDGTSNATGTTQDRRERVKLMRELQSMLGDQVRPLNDHLSTMDNTKAPDFDTYANWLTRQIILSKREAQGAAGGRGGGGGGRAAPGFTIDKYNEDMQVVVNLGMAAPGAAGAAGAAAAPAAAAAGAAGQGGPAKVIPPWLRRSMAQAGDEAGDGAQAAPSAAEELAAAKSVAAAGHLAEEQRRAAFMQQLAAQQLALQQQQQPEDSKAKPLPPWLLGTAAGTAGAAGAAAGAASSVVKQELPGSGMAGAIAVKQEGGIAVKQEASLPPVQQAAAAAGEPLVAPAAALAAAAAMEAERSLLQGDLEWEDVQELAAVADDADDIEWEDA